MKRYNKYGAKPKEYAGIRYHSTAEANYAQTLDILKRGGAIKEWTRQVKFELGYEDIKYVADFVVTHHDGYKEVHEVKGAETPVFRLNCKLWNHHGTMPMLVIKTGKLDYVVMPGKGKVSANEYHNEHRSPSDPPGARSN